MHRCLQLAKLGEGNVAPNPMVGAVLVHQNIIIGEGYHQKYGEAHAEVNCINSVSEGNKYLICKSTMYVSLEPCAHFGKTPPCADLLIKNNIPSVVIACRDNYGEVNGKGIKRLQDAGVAVTMGILEKEAREINKRFFTFHGKKRPYIILKWAQSANAKIANQDFSAVKISTDITNRLVHKWRSEEAAIMVGTNTALQDNPSLTTRLWQGNNPTRVVIDRQLKLPLSLQIFDGGVKTMVFNEVKNEVKGGVQYYKISSVENMIPEIMRILFQLNIQSLFVEGGAKLLQSFINTDCWDEARVIQNEKLTIGNGVQAPLLSNNYLIRQIKSGTDAIAIYRHT